MHFVVQKSVRRSEHDVSNEVFVVIMNDKAIDRSNNIPMTTFLPSKASVVVVSSAVDRHMIGQEGSVETVMVKRRPGLNE
jgi:hypothetical protein